VWSIFDKQAISSQQSAFRPEMESKKREKRLRPLGDRSVELGLGLCFQQKCYGGWGLAERRKQGLQESGHRDIGEIGRSEPQNLRTLRQTGMICCPSTRKPRVDGARWDEVV